MSLHCVSLPSDQGPFLFYILTNSTLWKKKKKVPYPNDSNKAYVNTCTGRRSHSPYTVRPSLKKMFVWHCLPRVSLCGSFGQLFFFFFFLNIYYLHMDGNSKKKSQIWKIIFLSSSKTGESVGNAKQTIFYFGPNKNKCIFAVRQNECFKHHLSFGETW